MNKCTEKTGICKQEYKVDHFFIWYTKKLTPNQSCEMWKLKLENFYKEK